MLSIKFASGADLANRQGCTRREGKGEVRGAPLSWLIKINAPWNCESIAGRRPQPAPVFWPKTNAISKRYQRQHAAEQLATAAGRGVRSTGEGGDNWQQSEPVRVAELPRPMLNSRRSKTKARHARSFASDNENEIENKASNAERERERRGSGREEEYEKRRERGARRGAQRMKRSARIADEDDVLLFWRH